MTEKKNLKSLVAEIKKLASPPPKPPAGYQASHTAPAPGRPATTTHNTDSVYQYSGSAGVKEMQKELIELSKVVTSQINVQNVNKGETDREKGEAAGRDSFGDFITKNYLRDSDVPGVEFDPNPNKTQVAQKTPSDPTRLGVIMDTMRRIGNPKMGEFAADGKWGQRTQAAVQNAYAFAFSLLKLSKDFKLQVKSYTDGNLATFKELISGENGAELPTNKKLENAPRISTHVQAIIKLYNEIKNGVLEKPEYRAYIEGDQPFVTYKNDKADAKLTQPQIDAINKAFGNKLQVQNKPISIANLLSLDSLKAWQQQNAPQMPLQNILISLKKQIPEEAMPAAPARLPTETNISRPGREG